MLVTGLAVDAAFLSPRFVGKKIGLHPVWLIFALFVFSYLFGLVGTLVAVPLAAAIGVLVRFAIAGLSGQPRLQGSGEVPAGGPAECRRRSNDVRLGQLILDLAASAGAG